MIISASRRTDIPAFYGNWFRQRLQAGYALAVNPYRPDQRRLVRLDREHVTAFVFWTKDPRPFLPVLEEVDAQGIPFVIQMTLTPYGADMEPGLRDKQELPDVMKALARRYGRPCLVWRYDPIIFTPRYTQDFHQQAFFNLAERLADTASCCVVSFFDSYRHLKKAADELKIQPAQLQQRLVLGQALAKTASSFSIPVKACCEAVDLQQAGIAAGSCIDPDQIATLAGKRPDKKRDPNQRPGCRCLPSVDIGAYQTCLHGCRYCYATKSEATARGYYSRHDPAGESLHPVK